MVYPILIITMKIYIDGLAPEKIKCSNFQNYLDKNIIYVGTIQMKVSLRVRMIDYTN